MSLPVLYVTEAQPSSEGVPFGVLAGPHVYTTRDDIPLGTLVPVTTESATVAVCDFENDVDCNPVDPYGLELRTLLAE